MAERKWRAVMANPGNGSHRGQPHDFRLVHAWQVPDGPALPAYNPVGAVCPCGAEVRYVDG